MHKKIDKALLMDYTFLTDADAISLMLSEHKDGRLTYRELLRVTSDES